MQPFFITATGTGIGKTLVTTALCWQLRQQGEKVAALKPVISGYDANDSNNDTALILRSCGVLPTAETAASISPWRFSAPVAPAMAEGSQPELEALVGFCRDQAALDPDILLVEGIGGLIVPLNETHTTLDWMAALGWPVIVVAGSYVGSINHTLMTVSLLLSKGLTIQALVISESENSAAPLVETVELLEKFLPKEIPIVKIPRLPTMDGMWEQTPPISWICDEPRR